MKDIKAVLQILIENFPTTCRYWRANDICRRSKEDALERGIPSDFAYPITNCGGDILRCQRNSTELEKPYDQDD